MADQLVALEVTGIQQTDQHNVEINLRAQQTIQPPDQTVNKVEESEVRTETPSSEEKKYEAPRTTKDVTLRFKIDQDTHEVHVILVDKESGKVIRSIPPDELKLLQEGELVELYA